MNNSKKRLIISWLMVLMTLLNIFPSNPVNAASVENQLTDLKATISQNGTEIAEGGTLTSKEPISVEISFGIPVEGDEPTPSNPVKKGDTAAFELSNAFNLISGSTLELKTDGITVGHVTFTTDASTKMVTANVSFDGENAVFDGTEGYHDVTCKFSASLQYDASGAPVEGEDATIQILGKTFTVNVPPVEKVYTVSKSGIPDLADKTITWKVDLSGKQGSKDLDLGGYTFSDDLSGVGEYVPDSFQVDPAQVPAAVPDWDPAAKKLSYTLTPGSVSPSAITTITFKTSIPDGNYYGSGEQEITNTARLMDGENTLKMGEGTVKFAPTWIKKEGTKAGEYGSSGEYNPQGRTITWTITANQMGATLDEVVITDVLPAGLKLKSASWQAWNGTAWGTAVGITPNASGEYEIGHINSQILLTIVTDVPDDTYTTGSKTYSNTAKIRWKNMPGTEPGTGTVNVGIGYNAIEKSGIRDSSGTGIVIWTVTVDTMKQDIPHLKVYDLLVYGSSSSGFDITKVTGIPGGVKTADLTRRYDQKYIDDSFAVSGSVTGTAITVHPIERDGKRVADLLEITGLSTSEKNTFTFKTQILNPDIYAGNTTKTVYNTATLFSADTKLNAADGNVSYTSNMLAKEMLKREAMADPAAGVNTQKTSDAKASFDYKEKAAIFRLSVNADGIDLPGMLNAGQTALGTVTLTDTLPAGWELTAFTDGSDYLIFEGNKGSSKSVTAKNTTPLTLVDGLSFIKGKTTNSEGKEVETLTFTFTKLDRPYVILIKAKLTDDTAAEYFSSNKTTTATNSLSLSAQNWTPGISTSRNVDVVSEVLAKTYTQAEGSLTWTIEYKPYDLAHPGEIIKDTLPLGIELRTDSSGRLLLEGNIAVNEMTLNADGSYTIGNPIALELGTNVSYDNASRILSFTIPDSAKAYRFTYITDITGEPGTITNEVALIGGGSKEEGTKQSYSISTADALVTMKKGGWIMITKIDGAGAPLAGAQFAIFAADGVTVIRKGVTGGDGTLKLKVLPDGEYILKETAAPVGYVMDDRIHSLTVTTTGSTVITSIDDKTGTDSNVITIKNFSEGTVGNLTISKTVAGNAADSTMKFDFMVTFEGASGTYSYTGNGVPDGTITSGDTISLAHGQSITIMGLPKDSSYTVSEADYSALEYSKTATGETGIIVADDTQAASFTNTKNTTPTDPGPGPGPGESTGNLTISKTVVGSGADLSKKFDFMVTFSSASAFYYYTGNGVPNGIIKSGDTISLAHGQSITITGLPAGEGYQVKEAEALGYLAESAGSLGIISTDQGSTAAFTNKKVPVPTGSLTIVKTVTGKGADLTKKFSFTVTFTGTADAYPYTGSATGTVRSGGTISLADGESVTITGLPAGTQYTVTEADYSQEGYTVSGKGAAGAIAAETVQTASFTNEYTAPDKPDQPKAPDNPGGNNNNGNVPGNNGGTNNPHDNGGPKVPGDNGSINVPGGNSGKEETGMPKTGDNRTGRYAQLGLFVFSAALAALSTTDFVLRKKHLGRRNRN